MQRLAPRLYDKLHEFLPGGLWVAERWRHAQYILAEEKDLVALPDELS